MRILVVLSLLFLALPSQAQVSKHSVIFSDKVSGSQTTTVAANGEVRVFFTYRDNGRGPDINEVMRLREDGTLASYRASGKSTFGAAIADRFERKGKRATWQSTSDRGETTTDGRAMYLPVQASFEPLAIAARALLSTPGATLKALPAGELSIEKLTDLALTNAGQTRAVSLYAIRGMDLQPALIWLTNDDARQFFGFVFPGYLRVVEQGWESAGAELERTQVAAEAKMLQSLAQRLTHELPEPILIRNVNVFDAEHAKLVGARDVYVNNGRIAAIYPTKSEPLDAKTIIEGNGRTLLPALFDMHTHESSWSLPLQIAAGVTSSRDMGNDNATIARMRNDIEAQQLLGPRLLATGFIEGESEFSSRGGFVVKTYDDVKHAIDWYAQHGYYQIKIYNSFKPEWVQPAAQYAHERGLRVGGHIPAFMRAEEAVRAGYDEIQHINQVLLNFLVGPKDDTRTLLRFTLIAENANKLDLSSKPVTDFIGLLRERGTAVDATIATFEAMMTQRQGEMNPSFAMVADHLPTAIQRGWRTNSMEIPDAKRDAYKASFEKMLAMIRAMHEAGVPIVAGTDEIAGFTLHRELELYVRAGIPAGEALRIATWNGAKYTGRLHELGSISPGKWADLILVDGNPIENISAIRNISLVMKQGNAHYPAEVYEALGVRRFTNPPTINVAAR